MAISSEAGESHVCQTCFKAYQRRDLLMRHRRRCQRSSKPQTRRKACDACVQAKARCCYNQPTCTRCANRGIPCQYVHSTDPDLEQNEYSETYPPKTANDHSAATSINTPPVDLSSSDIFDASGWTASFSPDPWPLDRYQLPLRDPAAPAVTLADFEPMAGLQLTANSHFPLPTPIPPEAAIPGDQNATSQHPAFMGGSSRDSIVDFAGLDSSSTQMSFSAPNQCTSYTLARILGKYPRLLLKDDFCSPFLHRALYGELTPDMTTLPLSSMAICCGSGMTIQDSARYVKRAVDSERQRLIEVFPTYQCMQQWDALHAMLLYELLELPATQEDESERWKQRPRNKGLQLPFLVKMTRCYASSYPEIRNPDLSVFTDPMSTPSSKIQSPWARWRITETARRTIFLANMVNFFINYNHVSGKQHSYYEPLDDDLILNIPLPCSQALWSARSEDEWRMAMQSCESSPAASHRSSDGLSSGLELGSLVSPQHLIKFLLSKFNKDFLRASLSNNIGFEDSDKLRNLIVLCAFEQFA